MRILVCGGRDYKNITEMYNFLDQYHHDITVLISGNARGADRMAEMWAHDADIDIEQYPADWETYGKRAGYIRNKQMLEEGKPDLVVAFPGGKGTAMMVKIARAAGVEVIEVKDCTD